MANDSFNTSGQEKREPEISDADLISAFVGGEVASFNQLVARYRQPLFAWLVGMTGNRSDAEDLYQEIWIRVIRHAARFKDVSFKAWMWKIARNLVIDFRRKRKPDMSLDAVKDTDDTPLVNQLVDARQGPAKRIEQDDSMQRVMAAVDTLPEVQRDVFLMRVQGNLSFSEIAEALEVPLNTALGRMHDAMTKLKRLLGEEVRT